LPLQKPIRRVEKWHSRQSKGETINVLETERHPPVYILKEFTNQMVAKCTSFHLQNVNQIG